ncbi:endonuclease/exonuclease/phosphatase family protein [Candidatus Microgenomates bacterium]|nr:endonuclease/exonuclease/phosphatase family protein [Candidatus Microgenomates bacterium]
MQIKVVSWNIWQGHHLKMIISFLKQNNADVIGLQEAIEKDGTNTAAVIAKELGYQCSYHRAVDQTRLGYPQGNAILSRYPIAKSIFHKLSGLSLYKNTAETEPRIAVEAKINTGNNMLTVFTVHLAYSHQFKESKMRNLQVDNLIKLLPSARAILMGDFNSHPDSLIVTKLNQVMVNADQNLTVPTWTVYPFNVEGFAETKLRHRLDYIFVSKDIRVRSFRVKDSEGSDHLPVSAIVEI